MALLARASFYESSGKGELLSLRDVALILIKLGKIFG